MAAFDPDAQSEDIEDRRGDRPYPARKAAAGQFASSVKGAIGSGFGAIQRFGEDTSDKEKQTNQDLSDLTDSFGKGYAEGGEIGDDDDDEDEDDTNATLQPTDDEAIPSTADDASMQEDTSALSSGQDQAASDTGPVPGAAQSAGAQTSELLALVRAVNQYGLHRALQGGQQPQQQRSFADGGAIDDDDNKGAIPTADDDVTGAIPTGQDTFPSESDRQAEYEDWRGRGKVLNPPDRRTEKEGPFTATEEQLNSREKANQNFAPNSAFGQAQTKDIAAKRQAYAQQGPEPGELSGAPQTGGAISGAALQSLMDYFRGGDAIDANSAAAVGYAVDPNGTLPPVEKAQRVIQRTYQKVLQETGDPAEAMAASNAMHQHQRKEYDMWRTAAAVKIEQGDIATGIEAANKALRGPFSGNVNFMQSAGGVTATVTDGHGDVTAQYPLGMQEFHTFLKSKGAFNDLVQKDLPDIFSSLTAPATTPAAASPTGAPAQQQQDQQTPAQTQTTPTANQQQAQQEQPGQPKRNAFEQAPEGVDQALWDTSRRIFPFVSQNDLREQWVQDRMDKRREQQNKIDVEKARGDATTSRAVYTQGEIGKRQDKQIEDRDKRQQIAIENRQELAHLAREAAAGKEGAQKRFNIARDLLKMYPDGGEPYKKALAANRLDYDRDILGKGTGAPQVKTPQVKVGGQAQSPAGAAETSAQSGEVRGEGRYKVGQIVRGFRFLGGNWRDRAAWERATGE